MSIPLGLALTGGLLVFVALVLAFAADHETWARTSERLAALGWVTFTIGVLALVVAIWAEVAR